MALAAKPQPLPGLVLGGLAAAWRNLAVAWRGAWAGLMLASLATGLWLASARGVAGVGPPALWIGPMMVAALMAKGATYRLAVGRGKPGPGGLQLGLVELNLLVVGLLTLAFLTVLGLLLLVALLCAAYAVASAGPGFVASDVATWARAIVGRGAIVFGLVALVGACGLAWAAARISLAGAVTVAKGEVQVLATWPLTRDRVASIVLAGLLTAAGPMIALALLHGWAAMSHDEPAIEFAARLVQGLVLVGLWVPLGIGLMAYFQRRLS